MITRIVRMSFEPARVQDFLAVFEASKERIRNFEGCKRLELLRDVKEPNVFFTYSYWDSEAHLNKYRFSELFKGVWAQTKIHFNQPPQAWSLVSEVLL